MCRRTSSEPVAGCYWRDLDESRTPRLHHHRNRYYDPSSGRFTQEDPIGLAGGLNLYGFANRDPVTYSDPYGLKIECRTQEACDLWNELARRATRASRSADLGVRTAARTLLKAMDSAYRDEKMTYQIEVHDYDWQGEYNTGGAQAVPVGNSRYLLLIDTKKDSEHIRNSPWINLAHELGGAMRSASGKMDWLGELDHKLGSLALENAARKIVGCSDRPTHNTQWYSNCEP